MRDTRPTPSTHAEAALDQHFQQAYLELRRLAHARLRRVEKITLLDTTELVHEAYMRFPRSAPGAFENDAAFLGYAAQVMRSLTVDFIRRRRALRRGGGAAHVDIDAVDEPPVDDAAGRVDWAAAQPPVRDPSDDEAAVAAEEDILRLSEAVDQLQRVEPRLAQVVEMRYFGGLTEAQIAASLGVTDRTVRRDWQRARILLRAALGEL